MVCKGTHISKLKSPTPITAINTKWYMGRGHVRSAQNAAMVLAIKPVGLSSGGVGVLKIRRKLGGDACFILLSAGIYLNSFILKRKEKGKEILGWNYEAAAEKFLNLE